MGRGEGRELRKTEKGATPKSGLKTLMRSWGKDQMIKTKEPQCLAFV